MKLVNNPVETIHSWFDNADPGDWVGIFENSELGHPGLGDRIGFLFGSDQWDVAEIGKTSAPDSPRGLGWRYLLKAKCRTREEALKEMGYADTATTDEHHD